jgi:hypothetical protein
MNAVWKAFLYENGGKILSQGLRYFFSQTNIKKTELTETLTSTESVEVTPIVTAAVHPQNTKQALPTSDETTTELKRRLAKELYKAELDLANGMLIAGKPCDCLDHKHGLYLEAASEELVAQDPDNPVYKEIIDWLHDNREKLTVDAIASGQYKSDYPHMANQFKTFRKVIMGSAAEPKSFQRATNSKDSGDKEISLDEAKSLAATAAAKEVERQWNSPTKLP